MRRPGILIALVLFLPVVVLLAGYLLLRDELRQQAVAPEPPLTQLVDESPEIETWPFTYGEDIYGDVAVEVTWRAEAGECRMSLRSSEAGAYTLALGADNLVTLYRGETEMGSDIASAILSGPPWHRLRLSVIGNVLRVTIDGEDGISVTDPDPLPPGAIVFSLGEDSRAGCTIDHFSLWVPADQGGPAE